MNTIKKLPTFAIGKTSDENTFPIKVGCYCAGDRHNFD